MKLKQLIYAGAGISQLCEQKIPIAEAYKLELFANEMQKHVAFYAAQIEKITKEYGGTVDKTGRYTIPTEHYADFEAAVEELREMDVEGMEPIEINVPNTIEMSANDIKALRDVIQITFTR